EWETVGILVSSGECVPTKLVFEPARLPDPKVMDIYVELDQMKDYEPSGGALPKKPDFFVAVGTLRERLATPPDPNAPGIGSNCSTPKFDAARFEATTFMHELGHTLGLWHGGNCSEGQPGCV